MPHPMKDVIVLVPGITGSVLRKNGRVVWGYSAASIGRALLTLGGTMVRDLAMPHDDPDVDDLDDGITADELMPDLHILPGLWKIDGYAAIEQMLLAEFDLTLGENYHRFPYDWRRDNRVSARKLERAVHGWLRRWRDNSGAGDAKVIFLAHSMGGLVCRWFLECLGGWRDTRALMTFGTPYGGSLNALNTLANGMKMKAIDLSPLGRQLTSIYQLLPTSACVDTGDGTLRPLDAVGIPAMDGGRVSAALAFHRGIAEAVASNRRDAHFAPYLIHPIVGIAQETMQAGMWRNGTMEMVTRHQQIKLGAGDGTVPRLSATPAEMQGNQAKAVVMYAATRHGSLQNADAVHTQIVGTLTGYEPAAPAVRGLRQSFSLEVPDLVSAAEPIAMRAVGSRPGTTISATLRHSALGVVEARSLRTGPDGTVRAEFPPQPAGAATIALAGDGIEPVEDAIAIVEADAATA